MRTWLRLPAAARNPVSLLGIALATAMAVLFAVVLLLESLGHLTNPYLGLLLFVALPAAFVCGLLLIPAGAWWVRRSGRTPDWPVIDLRDPNTRAIAVTVCALTIVNVVIVSLAAYGGVHYMDSTAFCTQTCHTTMEPQAVAHQAWPHAEVACAGCHIGPGAGAFVEAKLAGTRQLVQVLTGNVPTPVPSPQELIQPATVTCRQCHAPFTPERETLRAIHEYAGDETNSETVTMLRMHVGSDAGGIHRHNALDITFPASEKAQDTISSVRARYPDGQVRDFPADAGGAAPGGPMRQMDCTDCHNRPAHTFDPTPGRAVDRALTEGLIPRELPFVRREAVTAVSGEYADREAALATIGQQMRGFYASQPEVDADRVERAIAGAQAVWTRNVFPAMQVTWGTYPNQLGHVESAGCFRCHDERASADGTVVSQDCELCHAFE